MSDAGLHLAGLELLLAAVHAGDPKREILVRIGDAIREARILAAQQDGVLCKKCKEVAERDRGFVIEECAKIAEAAGEPYVLNMNTGAMMFRAVTAKIATAIRSLARPEQGGSR